MAASFESVLPLIPENSFLILTNSSKPDARLRPTKEIKKLLKTKQVFEKSFLLPAVWDGAGQKNLVTKTADELNLHIEPEAISLMIEAIGNDSSRIASELEKLAINEQAKQIDKNQHLGYYE